MKTTRSRTRDWPKRITLGNVTVRIYKRVTPNGKTGFMLAYQQDGKRKFDSFGDEAQAIQEANTKARQLSTLGVKAAQLTDDELRGCVEAMDKVKPLNISLGRAIEKLLEAVEIVGNVETVTEACRFFVTRNKKTTRKPVADVVGELLAIKESRGAMPRYMQDLNDVRHEVLRLHRVDLTEGEVAAYLLEGGRRGFSSTSRKADAASRRASQAADYAEKNPGSSAHGDALTAHEAAAKAHREAANYHDAQASYHAEKVNETTDADMGTGTAVPIDCARAATRSFLGGEGELPNVIPYMPAGIHTITPSLSAVYPT